MNEKGGSTMPSDFYVVLGISRNANTDKIKRAYRKIVKQYHPDTSDVEQSPEKFHEVQEAYETLVDVQKRKQYDSELLTQKVPIRTAGVKEAVSMRRSVFDEIDQHTSFADDFLEGFLPGFFHKERSRALIKDMYLEAILSPREAHEGGMYPITIPVIESCPRCQKSGFWNDFFCPVCFGYGRIHSKREFFLTIPPNMKHGTEISLSLEDIGLTNVRLNIRVFVDPDLVDASW